MYSYVIYIDVHTLHYSNHHVDRCMNRYVYYMSRYSPHSCTCIINVHDAGTSRDGIRGFAGWPLILYGYTASTSRGAWD